MELTKQRPRNPPTEVEGFFQYSMDMMGLADVSGYLKKINPAFCRTLGWSEQELLNRPFFQFVCPEDRQATKTKFQTILESDQAGRLENRMVCKDGSQKWLRWIFHPAPGGMLYAVAQNIGPRREREANLEKRTDQLNRVAQISQVITTVQDKDKLLTEVVESARTIFNLQLVAIFILSDSGPSLHLEAASGAVGRELVSRGLRLSMDEENSAVGRAARSRSAVLIADSNQEPQFLEHVLLSPARSELAIPIQAGEKLLGVLDMRASGEDHFDEQDIQILTALCFQIGAALKNARSFEQAQSAVENMNSLVAQLRHDGWHNFLQSSPAAEMGYTYEGQQLRSTQSWPNGSGLSGSIWEEPLQIKGQQIGQLTIRDDDEIDADKKEIIAGVLESLSAHLENLRLFEETQLALSRTDSLLRVSQSVIAMDNLEDLLRSIVDSVAANLPADRVSLITFDSQVQQIEHFLAGGPGHREVDIAVDFEELMDGLSGWVVREKRAALSPKGYQDPRESPEVRRRRIETNCGAILVAPMLYRNRLLGTVTAINTPEQPDFTEKDLDLLVAMANQAVAALENARLYSEQLATIERLQELDHLKSSFLANMSHELRTPLNSILGFTQVILEGLDGPLTENMQTDLRIVEKNGQHLLSLINDVLDMAKIEAGKFGLSLDLLDINALMAEVVDIASPLAQEKSLSLDLDVDWDRPLFLQGDPIRLRQVLLNVVGNAIKFTEQGGVRIQSAAENGKVRVIVRDTGIGIPPENLEIIFDPFSQVDESTTRKSGGTGLGLPISRRLIELHEGKIWAESAGVDGGGTVFIIELPGQVQT